MALFESYERRVDKINAVLAEYGINSIEECRAICKEKGFDPYEIVKGVQPIAWGDALRESEFTRWVYLGLCGLPQEHRDEV